MARKFFQLNVRHNDSKIRSLCYNFVLRLLKLSGLDEGTWLVHSISIGRKPSDNRVDGVWFGSVSAAPVGFYLDVVDELRAHAFIAVAPDSMRWTSDDIKEKIRPDLVALDTCPEQEQKPTPSVQMTSTIARQKVLKPAAVKRVTPPEFTKAIELLDEVLGSHQIDQIEGQPVCRIPTHLIDRIRSFVG